MSPSPGRKATFLDASRAGRANRSTLPRPAHSVHSKRAFAEETQKGFRVPRWITAAAPVQAQSARPQGRTVPRPDCPPPSANALSPRSGPPRNRHPQDVPSDRGAGRTPPDDTASGGAVEDALQRLKPTPVSRASEKLSLRRTGPRCGALVGMHPFGYHSQFRWPDDMADGSATPPPEPLTKQSLRRFYEPPRSLPITFPQRNLIVFLVNISCE